MKNLLTFIKSVKPDSRLELFVRSMSEEYTYELFVGSVEDFLEQFDDGVLPHVIDHNTLYYEIDIDHDEYMGTTWYIEI